MPHEDCVNLIKRAGDTLALKVVTANISSNYAVSHSLPYRRKGKINRRKTNKEIQFDTQMFFQHRFVRVLKSLLVVCSLARISHDFFCPLTLVFSLGN